MWSKIISQPDNCPSSFVLELTVFQPQWPSAVGDIILTRLALSVNPLTALSIIFWMAALQAYPMAVTTHSKMTQFFRTFFSFKDPTMISLSLQSPWVFWSPLLAPILLTLMTTIIIYLNGLTILYLVTWSPIWEMPEKENSRKRTIFPK